MSNLWIVTWSGSTIHQLIQSGNLRYFKNKEVIDKINSYYSWQNFIASINQTEHETRMQAAELRNKILQSRYYLLFVPLDLSVEKRKVPSSLKVDSLMKRLFPLQEGALNYLDEYINLINDRKWRSTPILNNEYPQIKNLAIEIMKLLQQEYNLK